MSLKPLGEAWEAVEATCPECGTEFTALVEPDARELDCKNCGKKFEITFEEEDDDA